MPFNSVARPLSGNTAVALWNPYFSRQLTLSNSYLVQHLRHSKDLLSAASAHAFLFKAGCFSDTVASNHLMNSYIRIGRTDLAHEVFDEMSKPNVVSYTALMAGYNDTGRPQHGLWLYGQMRRSSVHPNDFTVATVVNACSLLADLESGKRIHSLAEIYGFRHNVVVYSSLVDMYGKCNDADASKRVFDLMSAKNVVTWTAMISAYAQNARGNEALQLLREFNVLRRDHPNEFMLASAINACASLGRLVLGKVVHGAATRRGHDSNDVLASALLDMYAKCGSIGYSTSVFHRIPYPSVIPYTSMIVAAAKYGLGKFSLELFYVMISRRVKPNNVTFLGVLHACSHSGLVNEGFQFFKSMNALHGVMPDAKHYTCVVDMLARSGHMDEAYDLAKSVKPSLEEGALLWGALLSASRLHGRADIAVEASNKLIESDQQVAGAYVTLSNAYAAAGGWGNAANIRQKLKQTGISKEPGCSWVEVRDATYVFHAGDLSCERGREVLMLLRELAGRMREKGYVGAATGLALVEVEEEAREEMVALHSERLALAFGMITMPKSATIRIIKNLRMCRDCHEAFKVISEITQREFVVRDVNRFHNFQIGSCSCGDFW